MKNKANKYQAYLEPEMRDSARAIGLLGAILYTVFLVADVFAISLTLSEVVLIRGIVISLLMLVVAFTYSKHFIKAYNPTILMMSLISASGIVIMIYLAQPEDHATKVYFTGLLLIIMLMFAWLFMRIEVALLGAAIIIGSYAYVSQLKGLAIADLLVNILFLLSAAVSGMITQYFRDRHLRQNFLLTQSLKSLVNKKTNEAEDYAYKANHDELTGLPNRRFILQELESSLQIAKQTDKVLLILFIDLNGFKLINDTHGHAVGDAVLIKVARRLEQMLIEGDCISRLGGDEYLIGLMLNKDGLKETEEIINKFTAMVSYPMNIEDKKLSVGASIGIAAYPEHADNIEQLVDLADNKMYQVKQEGNSVEDFAQPTEENKIIAFPIRQ